MDELKTLLDNIRDSYTDFVDAILHYAKKKPSRLEAVVSFLKNNPGADSSDVIQFVSEQPDFMEDAAYMSVS